MLDQILDIIGRLLGIAVFCAVTAILPDVKSWIKLRIDEDTLDGLKKIIVAFVKAADQMYKLDDPTGEIRNKYVKDSLKELSIAITDEVNAYIESAVLDLKKEAKND